MNIVKGHTKMMRSQVAKTLGSTSIRHRSGALRRMDISSMSNREFLQSGTAMKFLVVSVARSGGMAQAYYIIRNYTALRLRQTFNSGSPAWLITAAEGSAQASTNRSCAKSSRIRRSVHCERGCCQWRAHPEAPTTYRKKSTPTHK